MLIKASISGYKHVDLGNIKLAFTQVCREDLFRGVYFAANALYCVTSGHAVLESAAETAVLKKGEAALIRQHSRLDIRKFRDEDKADFSAVIFYLFPDFVTHFVRQAKPASLEPGLPDSAVISLGLNEALANFGHSLLPLLDKGKADRATIQDKTFEALRLLAACNPSFPAFLSRNNRPIKIDLYEFMIHTAMHNYSVPELARLTGRSLSAFKRDFAAIFCTTPHHWLLARRLDCAAQLLTETALRASDIYLLLGFNELSHFSAAFKKYKGASPTGTAI